MNPRHEMREKQCDGRVLLFRVPDPNDVTSTAADGKRKDVRRPCRLCKSNTNFYCSGCKNFLCFGASASTEKKLQGVAKSVGAAPKACIRIPVFDPKTQEEWEAIFAANSCYLIQHKDAFSAKKDWNYDEGVDP